MSDEIDIEEHDVMDDPTIKRIFPDLSVIKKEINQYSYVEDLNTPTESALLEGQEDTISKDLEDHLPKYNQKSNEIASSPFHASEALETQKVPKCLYENIIILGTKPNLECQENNHDSLKKEPKLILKNVNYFLSRCKRYCKKCLILFPKENIFNLHMINVHTKRKNRQIEFMGRQVDHKLFKCNVCDRLLASRFILWRHFRNLHGNIKVLGTVDMSNNKIVSNESSQSKATTGPSCFHCQQHFPTQSSLIEHLYEVLKPNKIGSSDKAVNSANGKELNKEVEDDKRIAGSGLEESNESNKNNIGVTSYSRTRDKVDNSDSESNITAQYGDENVKATKRKSISEPLHNVDINLKKRNKSNKCNECSEQFNSEKELKYHINSIHIDTSNKTNENKLKTKQETLNFSISKKPLHTKFYKCFICSKYNVTYEYYSRHLINDHKIQEVTEVKKVPFESQCKFCSSKFSGINSYNVHLFKYHKKQLKGAYFSREEQSDDKIHEELKKDKHFALKNILFKCMKCDLYFLSSKAAMNHSIHFKISDTWKCSGCKRVFTRDDMVLHEKQHSFSQTFTVHTLTESAFSQVLYKCTNCTVHYGEENFLHHYLKCESETPNSLYCKVCDIIVNKDDMECHEINHKQKYITCCDFIIIEPDVIDHEHQSTNINKTENGKSNVIDTHVMPNTNNMKVDTFDMIDERDVSPITATKKKDKSDMIDEVYLTPNTATNKKDRSDIIDDQNISLNTNKKKKDKFHDRTYRGPNRTKTKNHTVKRFLKSRFGNESLVEYSKFAMSFCHTCKCFIGNMNLRKLHIEGKCGHMLKLVCKGCGLLLTARTHQTHKEYHKKEQASLHDYSFYDLKTEKRICPPVPDYPKCNSCGVHFLRNCDVKTHSCQEQDYITCNVCFMKLVDDAYKLHINFHSYSMPTDTTKVQDTAVQANTTNKILYVEPNSNVPNEPYITDIFYTCKSCHLTVNTYDTVVQHCHDHYDSDVVQYLTQKCQRCTLIIQKSDYKSHLNGKCNNESIKVVDFDPFYFRHNNDFWTKHIFAYVADEDISKILPNSIYRYECRLKMEKIQSGSTDSVLYKCDKCQVFIDPQFLYMHALNSRDISCVKLRKHPCAFCGLSFGSKTYRNDHEKDHESIDINLKSHKIVLYNKVEHESYNKIMYDASNRYILYQCRSCEMVVDKFDRRAHICDENNLKLCATCGLLLDKQDFDLHFIRHEELDEFDMENIIVVMFGKPKLCYLGKKKLSSTFIGTKYDYTIYKCNKCDLCLKTNECISEHICVLDNLKCRCHKCGLYFSDLDFKNHSKVHENNLSFDDLSMNIITFDPSPAKIAVNSNDKLEKNSELGTQSEEVIKDKSVGPEKQEIIYKCDCGLHFLEELNAQQHAKNCNPRMKISKQSCIKCDLLFTPGELFNHLLKHHCDKKLQFKFDIVHVSANKNK